VPPLPHLAATDPQLAGLIEAEAQRQHDKLRMIPSENYVSTAVLEATGSVLTNKYSEGYAGKRYYEGQQLIDPIETLTVERARSLFGVDHANVQPYSGSPANLAVYLAFLNPGDTLLGMALAMGGHLTHGSPVSVSGRWFRPVGYSVRKDTGRVDFDEVRELARAERPKVIFCGGTAIPRTIDFPAFAEIAREVGAALTGGSFDLVSGGTDNHLILIDLASKGIPGKPAAKALDRAGIELNFNAVPYDPRRPFDPSGIRLGTAALTTRGLTEEQMPQVAAWMDDTITAALKDDEAAISAIA